MVRVSIPMFYECPERPNLWLRRKDALLKAHVSPALGVAIATAIAQDTGVRLGEPHVEEEDSHTPSGALRKESFRYVWAV